MNFFGTASAGENLTLGADATATDRPMMTSSSALPAVPVFGLPGPLFDVIHITALCCISTATVVCSTLLVYLCAAAPRPVIGGPQQQWQRQQQSAQANNLAKFSPSSTAPVESCTCSEEDLTSFSDSSRNLPDAARGGRQDPDRRRNGLPTATDRTKSRFEDTPSSGSSPSSPLKKVNFWKWPIGERLVVYLATCDLLMSVSHTMDHAYMLAVRDHPPVVACTIFAFFLHQFIMSQYLVLLIYAVGACSLIVFERKLSFGRRDWRLLVVAFGLPLIVGVIALCLGIFGPSGAW